MHHSINIPKNKTYREIEIYFLTAVNCPNKFATLHLKISIKSQNNFVNQYKRQNRQS